MNHDDSCCDNCGRQKQACHNYECKREKINPVNVPTVGDVLSCDRRSIGKYYKDGALVKSKTFGGRKLDNWAFYIVDHENQDFNGFSPLSLGEVQIQHYLDTRLDYIKECVENEYGDKLMKQQETIDKLMEVINERLPAV